MKITHYFVAGTYAMPTTDLDKAEEFILDTLVDAIRQPTKEGAMSFAKSFFTVLQGDEDEIDDNEI